MLRKFLLPLILLILAYGFWVSPDFKEISAGVAIFLFGMLSLEEGFKAFSGGGLERILRKSTDKLYKSIGFGVLATTIMQSSSLVSVLTISFLGAGLVGLAQGIGIVFGANIGTTTGAWLVAGFGLKVNIASYAMPMLVFGVILIFQKSKTLKGFGYILAGLGFLFLGIHYMKEGFEAFKSTIDLTSFSVTGLKGLFIFTGIGIFATVVMQSSHATLVLIITALSVGQISYENALALAIGANVGTTITAIIGAMSSNIEGKRLAGAHLIFNMVTGLIAIIFIQQIIFSVDYVSSIVGISNDDYTLKLAVFHTIFNTIGVVVMIPFIPKLVIFLESTLKAPKDDSDKNIDNAKFLNDSVLELPSTAMAAIKRETFHLYENAFEIISHGINVKRRNILSTMPLEQVVEEKFSNSKINIDDFYNRKIKGIYGEIIDFSAKAQTNMTPEEIHNLFSLKLANKDIVEAIKDTKHLQKNLVLYSNDKNEHIREQYKNMRKDLVVVLRSIDTISTTKEEEKVLMLLSKVKLHAQKYDFISNGTLDNLIRKGLITNKMATSLMNDSSYAFDISKKLISMAEILYNRQNNDLLLDDEDVHTILKKRDD
jgi:phosphate:Na+ symporter